MTFFERKCWSLLIIEVCPQNLSHWHLCLESVAKIPSTDSGRSALTVQIREPIKTHTDTMVWRTANWHVPDRVDRGHCTVPLVLARLTKLHVSCVFSDIPHDTIHGRLYTFQHVRALTLTNMWATTAYFLRVLSQCFAPDSSGKPD